MLFNRNIIKTATRVYAKCFMLLRFLFVYHIKKVNLYFTAVGCGYKFVLKNFQNYLIFRNAASVSVQPSGEVTVQGDRGIYVSS